MPPADANRLTMKTLKTLAAVAAALCCTAALAGHPMRTLDVRSGLPSNEVNHVYQDGDGYVWIATNNGLCRYDGLHTRTQLKKWFQNGCKPTQNHFAAVFDSYVHKDDTIPATQIEDLDEILRLNLGVTRQEVEDMIAQHNTAPDAHNIGTATDFESALGSLD